MLLRAPFCHWFIGLVLPATKFCIVMAHYPKLIHLNIVNNSISKSEPSFINLYLCYLESESCLNQILCVAEGWETRITIKEPKWAEFKLNSYLNVKRFFITFSHGHFHSNAMSLHELEKVQLQERFMLMTQAIESEWKRYSSLHSIEKNASVLVWIQLYTFFSEFVGVSSPKAPPCTHYCYSLKHKLNNYSTTIIYASAPVSNK